MIVMLFVGEAVVVTGGAEGLDTYDVVTRRSTKLLPLTPNTFFRIGVSPLVCEYGLVFGEIRFLFSCCGGIILIFHKKKN